MTTTPRDADEKARFLLDVVEDRKAVEPSLLDLRGKTLLFDFCLVCSGTSNVHIRSIADALLEKADEADLDKPRVAGQENAEWVLLDFGDVVIHILNEESRERYQLEQFWSTPQPKGALPPMPDGVKLSGRGDANDEEDDEDAAFFDDADQEVEPIDEDEDDLDEDDDMESLEDLADAEAADTEGDDETDDTSDAAPRRAR